MRKTKIVVTCGPALMQGERMVDVLREADTVRLNASHGDLEFRAAALLRVRKLARELGREIPVFLDLQGPKWRVGKLEKPVTLGVGQCGCFHRPDARPPADAAWAAPLPHPELFTSATPGQQWLLDDGAIVVEVQSATADRVDARVLVGGDLKARKGVHPVGGDVAVESVTDKDREDIRWGVENNVDMFAQSFVRTRADVDLLTRLITEAGGTSPAIIAKIEHPTALKNLPEILDACWGVMVARGDLGVELGVHRVPGLQKQIIEAARKALKPVITATQMLESMIESPSPTRAEASDVANAVWDGTDAVMLSAESATGKYPVEAVRWLAKIAAEADSEAEKHRDPLPKEIAAGQSQRVDVNVAFAASRVAEAVGARWIVCFTEGGTVARMVSRLAGRTPVIAATSDARTARRVSLLRGVRALLIPRLSGTDETVESVRELLQSHQGLVPGDRVVMTMGLPMWKQGATNTLKVLTI
ncbi:MAG: pyruvate kinase [Deltaproteobacteria bacterium]|nr:pyruvate kinase [Deltaproteobacteria bacterium]